MDFRTPATRVITNLEHTGGNFKFCIIRPFVQRTLKTNPEIVRKLLQQDKSAILLLSLSKTKQITDVLRS